MVKEVYKKKQGAKGGPIKSDMDSKDQRFDLKSILKDIEFLGSSYMTWKEKKELENKKVVSLGGKNLLLGRFSGVLGNTNKRGGSQKRKPENSVLKSTLGNFRNGVLHVKHMLNSSSTPTDGGDVTNHAIFNKGMKKKKGSGGGKKNQGKKKGGGKRH